MSVFNKCDILVPHNIDLKKWSVVACDQYTSQADYWEELEKNIQDAPSALKIIYPEIYLSMPDKQKRIEKIHSTMNDYLAKGLFKELKDSFVLVDRTQRDGRVRTGLVGAVDLEEYDFSKGSTSLIRATEGTVIERIPPRVSIRLDAALEMPHILMLIDDPEETVIEPMSAKKDEFEKIYDFDLQMDSGHLTGYIPTKDAQDKAVLAIDALGEKDVFFKKYGVDAPPLQFAVGDGNHSLATAKTCWETIKETLSEEEKNTHPARFALVELMNVHDKTLEFEPIHRVVFDTAPEKMIEAMLDFYPGASFEDNGGQKITYCYSGKEGNIYIKDGPSKLAVGTLQIFLDKFVKENGGEIDYIHGADVTKTLSEKPGAIGFILPSMEKSQLFETVIHDGALPRKTFSMGEAHDKKYYMECKRIKMGF